MLSKIFLLFLFYYFFDKNGLSTGYGMLYGYLLNYILYSA